MSHPVPGETATTIAGALDAVLSDPQSDVPIPAATIPAAHAADASGMHEALRPGAAQPANSSSTAVWLAAAGLLVSAIVVYVFQQRIDVLLDADKELARELERGNAQVRTMEQSLAQVPAQLTELEQRQEKELQDALSTNEKQRSELAASAKRAEQSLAELQTTVAGLRKELDNSALAREERLDDLSHRLAQGDDAQREMAKRLEEYRKSAESARNAAEAAKALPEKPAAPAGPAWATLVPNLADANPSTRWEAVDELGRSKDPAVIPHIAPLLRDSDLFVRMCAARVLADLGTLQAVPQLIDALEDSEPTVRESAWNALRTLTGKDFKFDPQGNEADRQKKVKSWREWWKKEGEGLLNGGSAPDPKQPPESKSGTQKS
jgi:hypothetical protein